MEGLSWGSREGEELPFLEPWILLSHSSRSFLRLFRLLDFVPPPELGLIHCRVDSRNVESVHKTLHTSRREQAFA
ncbi:MAG: hypothetical protein EWV75_01715 [Microcystis wesenbergii Mw_QC_S_20081001_S30D]|uniref:Uncharacterized protein n=1 Tax=Microcystis wesenbergii Mw_QC_S_20081001_S30D TaxID=2486245 RepID=A0A552JZF1_9CHRO|nr:MAG: hypothetical protein EWV73_15250 [Microcystis wesenbergii Mw_QC_B_20070930_S4D]TRV01130.1 MAG: hypothetical protein EWV75_01715 [Microcystis wesenbergii Mw_QC_S_20081001_S30D]TRV08778.1 MAG: hypothetical protein EWV89_19895 [Microcystis wesenbergii Mw_QC_B_20070930_S4]